METDRRRIEVCQEYPLPYELYYVMRLNVIILHQSFMIGILTSANLETTDVS